MNTVEFNILINALVFLGYPIFSLLFLKERLSLVKLAYLYTLCQVGCFLIELLFDRERAFSNPVIFTAIFLGLNVMVFSQPNAQNKEM